MTSPLLTRRISSSAVHRFERAASLHERTRHEIDFRQARRRQLTKRHEKPADLLVGKPVLDIKALLVRGDQPGRAQHLEVPGGICDGDRGLVGERFDGAGALAEQVQQFQSLRGGTALPTRESCS